VFRHLQADATTRDIPVLLVTAKARVGQRQAWDEVAVAGVISKPFDPMTLAADVAALVGWPAPD
jgi:CheY-like chemotaxis protein